MINRSVCLFLPSALQSLNFAEVFVVWKIKAALCSILGCQLHCDPTDHAACPGFVGVSSKPGVSCLSSFSEAWKSLRAEPKRMKRKWKFRRSNWKRPSTLLKMPTASMKRSDPGARSLVDSPAVALEGGPGRVCSPEFSSEMICFLGRNAWFWEAEFLCLQKMVLILILLADPRLYHEASSSTRRDRSFPALPRKDRSKSSLARRRESWASWVLWKEPLAVSVQAVLPGVSPSTVRFRQRRDADHALTREIHRGCFQSVLLSPRGGGIPLSRRVQGESAPGCVPMKTTSITDPKWPLRF